MPPALHVVRTPGDLADFVNVPFDLFGRETPWVPPLKRDDRRLLTPGEHPFWERARRECFLVRDGARAVGRIAAIVDEAYNAFARESCGAFGFFDCPDDPEVAGLLLDAAREWLRSQGMRFVRGPLNPSTNYTCGVLVHGFDQPPAIMMPWNPPHYPALLERQGLRKETDLLAYGIHRDTFRMADGLKEECESLKADGRIVCRPCTKATLMGDIHDMLDIYRESWAENFGFVPLSEAEERQFVSELKPLLDPDFFVLFFHDKTPVAGMVALPDLTPLLRRLHGSLGPMTPWHFWRTRLQARQGYRIMLFGIRKAYRLMGLPLLLLDRLLENAHRRPEFKWVEGSWVLEDNHAVADLIEDFSGRVTKRYRLYREELFP
jgi:GNAT superfamily N-acetyltransferase